MNNYKLDEKVELAVINIAEGDIGRSVSGKYTNKVALNGFILQKPKFVKNDIRKNESCSFILHQITTTPTEQIVEKTYSLITYMPEIVSKLKELKNQCFISCVGSLERNRKLHTDYCQVFDIEIACLLEEELLPAYERANK